MIRLPQIQTVTRGVINGMNVPEPTNHIGVTMADPPMVIANAILSVGGYLAYLEHTIGIAESDRAALHETITHAMDQAIAVAPPQKTIRQTEAAIIAESEPMRKDIEERIAAAHLVERLKGLRNAYRAQYDALSRALSAKQLEAEVSR